MTEKTCGTCAHKGEAVTKPKAETYEAVPTGFFMCALIKSIDGARGGPDEPVSFDSSRDEAPKGKGAFVADASGYYASLCVEDDFGCNRWKSKAPR